jgi:hypothetical protein
MNRAIKGIKGFLEENNVKSVVISELYDIYIGYLIMVLYISFSFWLLGVE